MDYKIHQLAQVNTVDIGEGSSIWQFCVVLAGAKIGKNVNICSHCFVENNVVIGNDVTVKSGVQIWDGIIIENKVFIGPNVTFTNDLYPRSKNLDWIEVRTLIKKNASIGANATILAGVEIGEYSMIGAGSVVTKNIPPYTLWYGNPAVQKGYVTKEGEILTMDLKSTKTGERYRLINKELVKI
ncbi:WxcM-like protein [Pseudopedobacter saltans DSM 12145]|uniref:WxcM-like protein n=1 Tax=Pseudopedobacter saltans (strain ATCC 51119 / DSM 12145 / JCM 21818 / CCUG 39354 / LMG 10337 / NBRC 100064 / NCIMB 13643) TaxID=762903 RepID=F0S7T9_PSESL|nr:acyltransferase [Pseudopedobacter saltans]ADY53344.1 WxcM-like protein [Pseudopedobacter saltans DSM 12145]